VRRFTRLVAEPVYVVVKCFSTEHFHPCFALLTVLPLVGDSDLTWIPHGNAGWLRNPSVGQMLLLRGGGHS
jgi:hypothetical protein